MMKNKNYINIQGWMINELKLKGNELLLYAIIYGFTQDEINEYYGSMRYISSALNISKTTANSVINKLIEKKLIKLTKESHYVAVPETGTQCPEIGTPSVPETGTNNNNTNNNTNNSYDFFKKNRVSPNQLKKTKVKNKLPRDFLNERRREVGKEPMVKKLSRKQVSWIERSTLIEYFKQEVNQEHSKSYFTNPHDIADVKKENSKITKMLKDFYVRCDGDIEKAQDVISWYAGDYGSWADWKPQGCFRKDTVIDYENQTKTNNKLNPNLKL